MFTRATRYLSAAICALGLVVATGAEADDHKGWKNDRHGYHRGHDDRRHRDRHDSDRRDYRGHRSDWRSYEGHRDHRNNWRSSDGHRHHRDGWRSFDGHRRGWSDSPYRAHRCNDRRHYGHAHFHVPVRHYRREAYASYPYHGVYRDRGAEATVILSFPF